MTKKKNKSDVTLFGDGYFFWLEDAQDPNKVFGPVTEDVFEERIEKKREETRKWREVEIDE